MVSRSDTCGHGDDDIRGEHECWVQEKEDDFAHRLGNSHDGALQIPIIRDNEFIWRCKSQKIITIDICLNNLSCETVSELQNLFRCVLASLHEGVSVSPSVGPSVCPSVGRSHTSWDHAKVLFLTITTISTSENASYGRVSGLDYWRYHRWGIKSVMKSFERFLQWTVVGANKMTVKGQRNNTPWPGSMSCGPILSMTNLGTWCNSFDKKWALVMRHYPAKVKEATT